MAIDCFFLTSHAFSHLVNIVQQLKVFKALRFSLIEKLFSYALCRYWGLVLTTLLSWLGRRQESSSGSSMTGHSCFHITVLLTKPLLLQRV